MTASPDNYQIPKGVVSFRRFSKTPIAWAASTAFAAGAFVYQPASGNLYEATTGGTSAVSPATGPSGTGASITDGSVTWKYVPWVELGNAPTFEYSSEIETKEHFSSMAGVKERDKKVITAKKGSVKIVFEEATMDNLALAMLGEVTGSVGSQTFDIFSLSEITCQLKCEQTNDIGPRRMAFFGNVSLLPGGTVPFVSDTDDWAQYEMTGEINKDGLGKFGTLTELA